MRSLEQEPKLFLIRNSPQHRLLDQNLSPPKECGECSTPGNLISKEIIERNTFWSSSKYTQQWKDLEEFTQYLLASVVLSIFCALNRRPNAKVKPSFSKCFFYWRGLWTWPPWVICAPAFNHKLKKFCIYRDFSEIFFLRKLHKRTEEIRTGQWKGYYMEHWGSGTPQPANKSKMAERRIKFQETQ